MPWCSHRLAYVDIESHEGLMDIRGNQNSVPDFRYYCVAFKNMLDWTAVADAQPPNRAFARGSQI